MISPVMLTHGRVRILSALYWLILGLFFPGVGMLSHAQNAKTSAPKIPVIENIDCSISDDSVDVTITLNAPAVYQNNRLSNPDRVYFDIQDAKLSAGFMNRKIPVSSTLLDRIRTSQHDGYVRIVLDLFNTGDYSVKVLQNPFRIVTELHYLKTAEVKTAEDSKIVGTDAGMTTAPVVMNETPSLSSVQPSETSDARQQSLQSEPVGKSDIATPVDQSKKPTSTKRPGITTGTFPMAIVGDIELSASKTGEQTEPLSTTTPAVSVSAAIPETPPVVSSEKPATIAPKVSIEPATTESSKSADAENKTASAVNATPSVQPAVSAPVKRDVPPSKTIPKTSAGNQTMTRMLGLKINRIVLDPGHGGHDLGTVGAGGLYEKDLVLAIALELRSLLQNNLGVKVILTRDDDYFVSLEERTAIANRSGADLFISIHANSSPVRTLSGVETYYLDFAKTNVEREIAARENSLSESSVSELENLIKKIANADKSAESRELASIVQGELFSGIRELLPLTRDRGVRSAPFVVLTGASMPSILAEVAFLSNPADEKLLKKSESRKTIAKALYSGITGYMETLGVSMVNNQPNLNK